MSAKGFNKNSSDAITSRILTELKELREVQSKDAAEIKALQGVTNGRVRALEKWRWAIGGAIAALSTVVGWIVIFATK
jgi:hypothetical protein